MMTKQQTHTLGSLAEGLILKHAELGVLVDAVSHQVTSYDFFRNLAIHLIPFIQKSNALRTLVNRWERQIRAAKKELNSLKEQALEEVIVAYQILEKRLENSELLTSIQGLRNAMEETKGCLDGTRPVYIPSHFEVAADSLALACRLLIANGREDIVSDLVEVAYSNDKREPQGIAKCHFYSTMSKIIKENQKWGWDFFDRPHICWSYLWLIEYCWKLEGKDFENEQLKNKTIEDCERSGKLLGVHSFWVEAQSIRNKRQQNPRFFTVERFSKYLEVICNEILVAPLSEGKEIFSAGIYALSLTMYGDSLLLLIETDGGRKITPYLLHTYNTESSPYLFMKEVISGPDRDWVPSDIEMQSGSSSNLLDRAKLVKTLRSLFIKKGKRKGSIQLISSRIVLKDLDLSKQLAMKNELDDLKLNVYSPQGIALPKEWTTTKG